MITNLSGKHQRRVALLMFFIFYGELAATVYAGKRQILAAEERRLFAFDRTSDVILSNSLFRESDFTIRPEAAFFDPGDNVEKGKHRRNQAGYKPTIGGPGQPEMSTFQSVGADNMVNLFTGDFSYNIPLGKVGEYPINIFYNAGITMDQEASWVGLGWNINPGTISRNMRGMPDDYNEVDTITKVQSTKPDKTIGVTATKDVELIGNPITETANFGIFYNNRRGLGLELGLKGQYASQILMSEKTKDEKTTKDTIGTNSTVSAGVNINSQEGMSFNASFEVAKYNKDAILQGKYGTSVHFSSRQGLTDISISGESRWFKDNKKNARHFWTNGKA